MHIGRACPRSIDSPDGHHRISVARALGQKAIEATVAVWQVAGPLPWEVPSQAPSPEARDLSNQHRGVRREKKARLSYGNRLTAIGAALRRPAPVFMYRFDWATPVKGGRLGAHHALEIPFVFDNLHPASGLIEDRPDTQALAGAMSEAWLAFARAGDPNHPALPEWPAYSLEERSTMIFDTPCRVELDPGREERLAWQGVKELQIM